jgi:hypothetical protein
LKSITGAKYNMSLKIEGNYFETHNLLAIHLLFVDRPLL